jgi:rare lipoprotein A
MGGLPGGADRKLPPLFVLHCNMKRDCGEFLMHTSIRRRSGRGSTGRTARHAAIPLCGLLLALDGPLAAAEGSETYEATLPAPAQPLSDAANDYSEADEGLEYARDLGVGVASYYGARFAGKPTASGAIFDPGQLTAAHRTLPFGSKIEVTNERTGESVVVTINDRGPFQKDRVIDLSRAAASQIGLVRPGRGPVSLRLLAD